MSHAPLRAAVELFSSVKPERAADAVVRQILDLIQGGRLQDQQVLPGERRLAIAMGVSRNTIREAIEILQDAGVLAVEPGGSGGTRVASIWMPEALVADHEPWDAETVFEALEARRVIEPRVAQLAALRGTSDDFEAIRRTIDLQRAHQSDWWQITQGNVLFHRLLWRAARNPELESAMRSTYRKLSGPLYQVLSHDQDSAATAESIDLHLETLDAIKRGDQDVVDEVMDRHLRYLEQRCEAMFGRARFPRVPDFLTGAAGPR
jgi:GntR family transcriptional repressor for pyruvate dehydrogenase complex